MTIMLTRAKGGGEMTRRIDIKSNLSRAGTSRSGDRTKKMQSRQTKRKSGKGTTISSGEMKSMGVRTRHPCRTPMSRRAGERARKRVTRSLRIPNGKRRVAKMTERRLGSIHPSRDGARETNEGRAREAGMRYLNRCLLYTSPSPRDRTRSRMPSSA